MNKSWLGIRDYATSHKSRSIF